jgi:hypothetical protein
MFSHLTPVRIRADAIIRAERSLPPRAAPRCHRAGHDTGQVTDGRATDLAHRASRMMPSVWRWPERTRLTQWRMMSDNCRARLPG